MIITLNNNHVGTIHFSCVNPSAAFGVAEPFIINCCLGDRGNVDSDIEFPRSLISSVLRKELNIIGTWNSNYKNKNDDWIDSLELLRKKVVKPSKFVTEYIKVEEVEKTIKKMYDHKTGKKRYDYIKYSVDFKS